MNETETNIFCEGCPYHRVEYFSKNDIMHYCQKSLKPSDTFCFLHEHWVEEYEEEYLDALYDEFEVLYKKKNKNDWELYRYQQIQEIYNEIQGENILEVFEESEVEKETQ